MAADVDQDVGGGDWVGVEWVRREVVSVEIDLHISTAATAEDSANAWRLASGAAQELPATAGKT